MGDGLARQQSTHQTERFLEAVDPMVVGNAEGVVLALVPAGTHAEDETTTGDAIDRRRHLGQHRRLVKAQRGDQRTDLDP